MNQPIAARIAVVVLGIFMSLSGRAAEPATDPARGELLFQTCAACHSVLGDGIGPDLTGIYGSKAAARPGFAYSAAMKESGIVWNETTLRAFIEDPQATVKGTAMLFPGYKAPADVAAVLAYLKTLK